MTNFPKEDFKKFKHLKQECFGDQKKVTEELLKTLGLNEEYLYKFVRKLQDLTDPITKRIFKPSFSIDYSKSYNCYVTSHNSRECVCISDETETTKIVDFNPNNDDGNLFDDNLIVNEESTVVCKTEDNENWAEMQQIQSTKQVPITTTKTVTANKPVTKIVSDGEAALDSYCHGAYKGMTDPNGHWFIGFDSSKIPDDVKKKPYGFHKNQVMRAVTFKAGRTGIITKINTGLMTEGNPAGSMVVEIVPVTKKGYPNRNKILARSKDKFKSKSNKIHTFHFSKGHYAQVKKGETYAIIFSAPLCRNGNNYMLCGWRRACYNDNKKTNSKNYLHAFGSSDGGKNWTKYMSKAKITGYSSYYDRPSAFPFEVTIKPTKTITTYQDKQASVTEHGFTEEVYNFYPTDTKDSLLLKIDIHGKIKQFQITGGSDQIADTNIHYYVSKDGRNFVDNTNSGASIDGSGWYNEQTCPELFTSIPENLFVKALLSTSNQNKTPKLRNVTVHVEYEKPTEAYIRTKPFAPEKDQMLAANVWENFNIDLENNNAQVYIDLIREDVSKETFYFVNTTVEDLQKLILDYATLKGKTISEEEINTDTKILNFVKEDYLEDKSFINWLSEENNCYILGGFVQGETEYKFFEFITLDGVPSYPIQATTNLVDDEIYEDFKNSEDSSFDYSTSNRVSFPIPKQFISGDKHIIDSISLIRTYAHTEDDEFVDDLIDEILLYQGELGTNIPVSAGDSAGREYDYTIDMNNKKIIFDITQGSDNHVFGRYCNIINGEVNSFTKYNESDKIYKLEIRSNGVKYVERLDFITDYDSEIATITWNDEGLPIQAGQLTFEYNPVFCNNITPEELLKNDTSEKDYKGIKLDLWSESFNVTNENNEFKLKGYPVNQLREVYPLDDEDTQYTEDIDYVVDYDHKIIKFNPNVRGETVVEYTPNLTDSELSLGIHIKRENTTDNCYIYSHSFSYRS